MTTLASVHRLTADVPDDEDEEAVAVPARMIVVFGNDVPTGALAWAERRSIETGREIVLVRGWLTESGYDHRREETLDSPEGRSTQRIAQGLRARGARARVKNVVGDPLRVLTDLATPDDLLVVTTPEPRWRHPVDGDLTGILLRHGMNAVLVVPTDWTPDATPSGRVVLVWDGTDRCSNALAFAATESVRTGLPLRICRITAPTTAGSNEPHGIAPLRKALAAAGVRRAEMLNFGLDDTVANSLLAATDDASLLVVGTHHAWWLSAIAGLSVTNTVARHARCPVAVVPARD